MRYIFGSLAFLFLGIFFATAQDDPRGGFKKKPDSVIRTTKKPFDRKQPEDSVGITIKDYKIISFAQDTTYLDTTLTIAKEYKYNLLRKDDFELLPFSNVGQPYNALAKNFESVFPFPELGASAKHFAYIKLEDVDYYNVPTPMTDMFFKTTFEQGQLLDALLTFNTHRRLNFSVAYRGFRSLGKYNFDLAESSTFRTTFNYVTADNRYWVRGHLATQDFETEENGGLSEEVRLEQFESGEDQFKDRGRVDVQFSNADNRLLGRRYYLDHQYNLVGALKKVKSKKTKKISKEMDSIFKRPISKDSITIGKDSLQLDTISELKVKKDSVSFDSIPKTKLDSIPQLRIDSELSAKTKQEIVFLQAADSVLKNRSINPIVKNNEFIISDIPNFQNQKNQKKAEHIALESKEVSKKGTTVLGIRHRFNYETKFYQFLQNSQSNIFGNTFATPINDKAKLQVMSNSLTVDLQNKTLGNLSAGFTAYQYNYFFKSILITDAGTISNKLDGNELLFRADYKNTIGKLKLAGNLRYTVSGTFTGELIKGSATYQLNENNSITGRIQISNRLPNFNFLLYQSDYENFNWQNTSTFNKQQVQQLGFQFNSKTFGSLDVSYSALDNYTYFASEATELDIAGGLEKTLIKPFQSSETINYLKVKYQKELSWRKWALNNTVMYQNVSQESAVLNVPELVTRNTLYFSSDVFKKAMYLQTGVTLKYFTEYYMDGYHPVLGEFFSQNREKLGGFPLLDFFINAKVRQTRIYLKAEHFNTLFSEPNYYSAPGYPYRDFVVRFGLVWNFFS